MKEDDQRWKKFSSLAFSLNVESTNSKSNLNNIWLKTTITTKSCNWNVEEEKYAE
jgi:hypothetical protein